MRSEHGVARRYRRDAAALRRSGRHFADAASTLPAGHEDERWKYLNAEAEVLYRHGNESRLGDAFESAIERYRAKLGDFWRGIIGIEHCLEHDPLLLTRGAIFSTVG
jgi:hypothetical protein